MKSKCWIFFFCHVVEAAEAAKIQLTAEEIAKLEALADATGIDTRGGWEHSME